MTLNVQLFGPLADAAGMRTVRIESAAPLCAGGVIERIAEACPKLRGLLPAARLAVNHAFASADQRIAESDELALIGMVSGG